MPDIIATLRSRALATPERPALDDCRVTLGYAELERRVCAFATFFDQLGCRVIGLLADNGFDWIVADLAALASGRTLVPVPPWFSESQLEHVVATSGIDTMLVGDPAISERVAAAGFEPDPAGIGDLLALRRPLRERVGSDERSTQAKVTFTSGSTGQPKGVCLAADTINSVATRLHDATRGIDAVRHLCVMPLATLLENIAGVYVPLLRGATVHVPPLSSLGLYGSSRLDPTRMRHTIDSLAVQSLILQPELLRALTASYRAAGDRNRSLEFVAIGGARVTDDDLDEAAVAGIPAFQGYGLSECASVVSLNRPGDMRRGSVGRPLPGIAVSVSADGEILVNNQCMQGYVGDSNDVDSVHTGDLGHLDDDGFLYVTGRAKNMFITSFGRNVSPEWPESELMHEVEILHACVFGEGRPANTAVIVPATPGMAQDDVASAIRRANARLPDYARIAVWILASDEFSVANGLLTATGKPRREAVALRFFLGDESALSNLVDVHPVAHSPSKSERTHNETL